MNKLLLTLSGLLMLFGTFAQTLPERSNAFSNFNVEYSNHNLTKAAGDSCGYLANAYLAIDKVVSSVWFNGPYYGAVPGTPWYSGAGQYFTAPQDMRISGFQSICYFSPATTADSVQLVGELFQANADSTPGAMVGVDTIWFDVETPGTTILNYVTFNFDNRPVMGGNGFFLSARIISNDSIFFLSNDDGQGEDLSFAYWEDADNSSNNFYDRYLQYGPSFDYDHIFFPIFKTEYSNDFILSTDTICRGSDVCLDVINVAPIVNDSMWNRFDGNDTLFLAWDTGNGNEGDALRSYCITPTSVGDVNIMMRDTIDFFNDNVGKCPLTVTHQIYVVDSVDADFTFTNTGLQVDFTNTTTSGNTYLWDFGDMSTSTDTNTTHTFAANGVYVVHLKGYNQCFEDSSIQSVDLSTVGTEEFELGSILIYPNPTQNILNLRSDDMAGKVSLTLVDILGKTLLSKEITKESEQINLAQFGQGTYFLRLKSKDKMITRKVIVR